MTTIIVTNKSSCVSDDETRIMVQACNLRLPAVASAWSVSTPLVYFSKDYKSIPNKSKTWNMYIIDTDKDVPGALAYHTESGFAVYGNILAKTTLDSGGVTLYKDNKTYSIAGDLFHEIAETMLDKSCNGWWYSDQDGLMYASEICDPVQDIIDIVSVVFKNHTYKVALSDFIYPAWNDTQAPKGTQLSFKNSLVTPFSKTDGGYFIVLDPTTGEVSQVFGEHTPEWIKKKKQITGRGIGRKKKCEKKEYKKHQSTIIPVKEQPKTEPTKEQPKTEIPNKPRIHLLKKPN